MKIQDPYLSEVFPKPPLVAFKRQKNIKDYIIRSKIPKTQQIQPKRSNGGMKKCGKSCPTCPFIREGKYIKLNKGRWEIHGNVNCETKNVIYLIECKKENCKLRYIGETERKLKERIADHKQYTKSIVPTQATGEHFNLPGHSLSDITVTIIEKVKQNEETTERKGKKCT